MRPLALLSSCLVMVACSGNPPGPDAGNTPPDASVTDASNNNMPDSGTSGSLTQAYTDLATAECNLIGQCYPFLMTLLFPNANTCATRLLLELPTGGLTGLTVTPGQIETCVSAINGTSCTQLENNQLPASCQFTGSLANGTACGSSSQCQTGYCKMNGTCGTCAVLSQAGGTCNGSSDCVQGLACGAGSCVTPGAAGATCSAAQPCLGSLFCNTTNNICTAFVTTAGAACPGNGSCSEGLGLTCSSATGGVCAQISTAMAGNPCGLVGGGFTVCAAGGTCVPNGATGSGTCAAPIADGQPCGSDGGTQISCQDPATCTAGVCTLPSPGSCH
jgi:hypothetical protein